VSELLGAVGLLVVAVSTLMLAIANIYATKSRRDLDRRLRNVERHPALWIPPLK